MSMRVIVKVEERWVQKRWWGVILMEEEVVEEVEKEGGGGSEGGGQSRYGIGTQATREGRKI